MHLRGREGGREGGREEGREGGREGGREKGREGEREGGRKGGRKGLEMNERRDILGIGMLSHSLPHKMWSSSQHLCHHFAEGVLER